MSYISKGFFLARDNAGSLAFFLGTGRAAAFDVDRETLNFFRSHQRSFFTQYVLYLIHK